MLGKKLLVEVKMEEQQEQLGTAQLNPKVCPGFEEYQRQLLEEKIERDKDFTTRKAERANLRVVLRDKHRLPGRAIDAATVQMAGDDTDLPEELAKMVEDEEEEEVNDSFLNKFQNMDVDMNTLRTKAQATVMELKQTAEQKCILMGPAWYTSERQKYVLQ